jgi:maltooligosyltrehalose trehalohydrolase
MNASHWHLPFGANLIGANRTQFRIWAPAQSVLSVTVEDGPSLAMGRDDAGWFTVEAHCGAGTRYRYVLADGTHVPDPAARAQSGDVHGPSIVVDPRSYRWRNQNWRGRPWQEAVIYELHVGLLGGFSGVAGELSRLAELGITAIELMPIAEFPGSRNWGYDGVLPFAPESSYGSPDELKNLIDAAHDHELMIFLDVVYNHFGPDGNYLHLYAPQMFRTDRSTPWGQAIDFRRREVRRYFIENVLYWLLEYRFDGLRFDAANQIPEQDWLEEMAAEVRRVIGPERKVHLVLENDNNAAEYLAGPFDAQWNDDGHHILHHLLTGERDGYYQDYSDNPATRLARCLKEGFIYQGERSPYRGGKARGTLSAELPPTAFVLFLQNHDQIGNRAQGERLTSLVDPKALEAAIALQILCPQIPLIFMGEERASRAPFLFFTDHNPDLARAVREGRRREFASFSPREPEYLATIPDPNEADTFERSKPASDGALGAKRKALYKQLLAIRRAEIVPRLHDMKTLDAHAIGPAAVIARWQVGDDALLMIASNLGAAATAVSPLEGRLLFASSTEVAQAAQNGTLQDYCTVAFLKSR